MKNLFLLLAVLFSYIVKAQNYPPTEPSKKATPLEVKQNKDLYYYAKVDVKPEFPGDAVGFQKTLDLKIIKENLESVPAKEYNTYVTFVIEKDGSMTNAVIKRDPGYGVGNEVLRALKEVDQKWKPGLMNNNDVRVLYSVPVTIQIP
jgi:protein TonB